MSRPLRTFFTVLNICFLFACTSRPEHAAEKQKVSSVADKEVNLAIWSNYISNEFLAEFEKASGIKVHISNYTSNEELLGKLQAGGANFDVAIPSDYMVEILAKLDLIQPFDPARLTIRSHIDPKFFSKPYDPENKYSIPYGWGTTGIAYNKELYKGPTIKGWKDLFDNPTLAGKFSLLDDVRETLGAALKYRNLSLNTKSPVDLEKAKNVLLKVRKGVKAFSSDPFNLLVQGEVAVAHAYSSDALRASYKTNGKIDFVIPEEGATQWVDTFVIPKGAPHLEAAHQLINFLVQPKINAARAAEFFMTPVVIGAADLLPLALQKDRRMFPELKPGNKMEIMSDLGKSTVDWDRIWTEVKSASTY